MQDIETEFNEFFKETETETSAFLAATPESEPGLDDLEALLAESLENQRDAKAGGGLREKLRRATSAKERAETEALLRAWEDRREWETIADAQLYDRCTCQKCGHIQTIFGGLYKHQKHRPGIKAERWVKVTLESQAQTAATPAGVVIPRQLIFRESTSTHCISCAFDEGWGDSAIVYWKG